MYISFKLEEMALNLLLYNSKGMLSLFIGIAKQ